MAQNFGGGFQPPPMYPPPQGGSAPVMQQPGGYGAPPPVGFAPQQPPPQGYGGPPPQQMGMQPLNVPPGLEYLLQVDHLIVKQKVEWLEALFGCETKNKYKIMNVNGEQIYEAEEETDCCTRNFCGPNRPFDLEIRDSQGNELIHLYRPFRSKSCLCPCFLQVMEVYSPPGTLVGTIEQEWSVLTPQYVIRDGDGNEALRIEGPICTFSICGDVEFKVLSPDGSTQVGKISKEWSGILKEAFTDADIFGISFPMDLDVRMKAVLLGACMLIDYNYFEKANNEESDRIGMLD